MTIDAVIEPVLVEAVRRACQLETLRAGGQILRDYRGWKTGKATIQRLWIAEIEPAFLDPACLAVLTIDQRRLAVFARGTWMNLDTGRDLRELAQPPSARSSVTVIVAGPYELGADWVDPVVVELQRLDAWPAHKDGVTLDGIGYRLFADSIDAQGAMRFANPRLPTTMALEAALLQAAHVLAARDTDGVIAEYIQGWMPYLPVSNRHAGT